MADFDAHYRSIVLATADAPWVKNFLTRNGWRLGVGRFVAGRDVTEAVPKLEAIEGKGRGVILDLLGEFVSTEAAARVTAERILASIDVVREAGIEPYFSVKPSQLGLGVGFDLALELADGIAERLPPERHVVRCLEIAWCARLVRLREPDRFGKQAGVHADLSRLAVFP